jgi:hypothetical protein
VAEFLDVCFFVNLQVPDFGTLNLHVSVHICFSLLHVCYVNVSVYMVFVFVVIVLLFLNW